MARDKVIQVQKKAQSLEQFQRRAAGEGSPLLRGVLMGMGALVVGIVGWGAWTMHQTSKVEAFETKVSALRMEVEGDGVTPVPPDQLQGKMQAALPRLETLVNEAPSSRRLQAEGLLATWKLELTGQGGVSSPSSTPQGRIREALRLTALGQGKEAKAMLDPLRVKATETAPWAQSYWESLLEVDRLNGDRDQAFKDLGEYRARFKDPADLVALTQRVKNI